MLCLTSSYFRFYRAGGRRPAAGPGGLSAGSDVSANRRRAQPPVSGSGVPRAQIQVGSRLSLMSDRRSSGPTEPVAAGRPQVQEVSQFGHMTRRTGASLSLACPAQAYPLPRFRSV